jgi:hypothetical protein
VYWLHDFHLMFFRWNNRRLAVRNTGGRASAVLKIDTRSE